MPRKTYHFRQDDPDEGLPKPEAEEPIYLPGASATEPSAPWAKGWPQQIVDPQGESYWRLRDGAGAMGTGEQSTDVIYGKILRWEKDKPVVEGNYQYLPTGKTLSDLIMQAGAWYAADNLDEDTYIRDLNYQ
jgi:hypothetical protein